MPLSDEVKDLLGKMISVDPLQRATMADIQVPARRPALCPQWFVGTLGML